MHINDLVKSCGEWAQRKGWTEHRSFGDDISLMHSELSEALEEYRDGRQINEVYFKPDKHGNDKPEGVPIELADVIIRILHFSAKHNIDLEGMIDLKMAYNESRPFRHGNKVL